MGVLGAAVVSGGGGPTPNLVPLEEVPRPPPVDTGQARIDGLGGLPGAEERRRADAKAERARIIQVRKRDIEDLKKIQGQGDPTATRKSRGFTLADLFGSGFQTGFGSRI